MNYKHKYKKYKQKYMDMKENKKRHDCKPSNKYSEICIQNIKGQYKSKDSCINDCENKYINYHLIKANIKGETVQFYLFIKDIINNEKINVYIKGGNVIGLYLLKMIYDKYKDDNKKFKEVFYKFLELELIKDWDFAAYTNKTITPEYRIKLDTIAEKYKLVPRAKTFILYQAKRPLLIDDKALFEISILDSDKYSKLEIPMTTMKIRVTEYNLKYINMFSKSFLTNKLKGEEFDFDILKKMIRKTNIIIHPHKDGLYDPGKDFDNGGLNDQLMKFINDFTQKDKKLSQFLVIHLADPFRLLFRLPEKNIPKTNKIKKFIREELHENKTPSWLIDTDKIIKLVQSFVQKLGDKLADIYSMNQSMASIVAFLDGVNFNRTRIEYDNITEDNKKLLKQIFSPLVNKIGIDNIESLEETSNLITFIKFLINKGLF